MVKRSSKTTRRKPKAVTTDILGPAPRKARIPSKWRQHHDHLVALRELMLRRQERLAKDALDEQPTFSSHMADAGTDTYDQDFALGMLSSEQNAVYEIDEALDRVRNGTYGKCEATGKPIEAKRLEAIPWTRFSAEAEKELEKAGQLRRTRLGPRETVAISSSPVKEEEEDEAEEG